MSGCCRPHPLSTAAASIRCCRHHRRPKKIQLSSAAAVNHRHPPSSQVQCGIHQRELFILKMTRLATRVWILMWRRLSCGTTASVVRRHSRGRCLFSPGASSSPRALKRNHSFFSCFWISPQVTTSKVGRHRQSPSIKFRMLVSLGGRRRHRARRSGLCVSLLRI